MKSFCALTLAPMLAWGALCDDNYEIQWVRETVFSGNDPRRLTRSEVKILARDLSDLELISPAMDYWFMAGFEGACEKQKKPVRYLSRMPGAEGFTPSVYLEHHVLLHDSASRPNGIRYQYWFGIFKPQDSLFAFVGRFPGETHFSNWAGYMAVTDSVRNPESGLWSASGSISRSAGMTDSLSLDKTLLDGYRSRVYGENRRAHFRLQFLQVGYGPVGASAVGSILSPNKPSRVSRFGNLLILSSGAYDASGRKRRSPAPLDGLH